MPLSRADKIFMAVCAALLIFCAGGLAVIAHPHPQPKSCTEWCNHVNCTCWEECKRKGEWPPANDCTAGCNEKRDKCEVKCGGV